MVAQLGGEVGVVTDEPEAHEHDEYDVGSMKAARARNSMNMLFRLFWIAFYDADASEEEHAIAPDLNGIYDQGKSY